VLLVALVWSLAAATGVPEARAAAKGIVEPRLEQPGISPDQRAALIREIGPRLHARWVRLVVNWSHLEPEQGTYATAEVECLDGLVSELRARGIKVILTTCYVPAWASDRSFWNDPPPPYAKGPQGFSAISADALDDYARLAEWLALHFRGRVSALECWNEPNLWSYIYPQRTATDDYFAARVYLRMLKAFHAGVTRARTGVAVVAGVTAPVGLNDRMRTSPQRFARFLKRERAGHYFDVYSHHPYTPVGSIFAAPDKPPNDPTTTVTLYNLKTLLRLFPNKPFYLTEYGYGSRYSLRAARSVTRAQQATYLKTAYAYVRRYPQVKVLLWYLLHDSPPAPGQAPEFGIYSGLRDPDGARKPAWYVYRSVP
jgi:hypothetical protein